MPVIIINLDPEGAWEDIKNDKIIHLTDNDDPPIIIAVVEMGMMSGRPSVAIRIDLPDHSHVIAETSARLFCMAAQTIEARYPGLFDD